MESIRRNTSPVIAMCQNPDGDNEHVPLAPGEKITSCFAECDCTPAIYVALDAVVEELRTCDPLDIFTPQIGPQYADHIERKYGNA